MASTQQTRLTRKMNIPDNYILKWQAETQGPKKLVRRPMTACKACRISKVKCSGQNKCDRCTSRGIPCSYSNTPPTPGKPGSPKPGSPTSPSHRNDAAGTVSQITSDDDGSSPMISKSKEETLFGLDIDSADFFGYHHGETEDPALGTKEDWANWANWANPQTDSIDWTIFGLHQNALDPSGNPVMGSSEIKIVQNLWSPGPVSVSQAMNVASENELTSVNPSMMLGGIENMENCHCKSNMVSQALQIKAEMQEWPNPRLDRVFKVTESVIHSCQSVINCKVCQITCTDLVCITAVFQQTDRCFDYMAKADAVSPIKVKVGEYEISTVDNRKVRRILVIDLVRQANELLDCLNSMAQHLFLLQPAGCRLGQINLVYLQEVVNNLRNILQSITASFKDKRRPDFEEDTIYDAKGMS